jgi:hypothetical protein
VSLVAGILNRPCIYECGVEVKVWAPDKRCRSCQISDWFRSLKR